MEYEKCENYPRCAYAECECNLRSIFKAHLDKDKPKNNCDLGKEIIKFEIVNGEVKPVYKK